MKIEDFCKPKSQEPTYSIEELTKMHKKHEEDRPIEDDKPKVAEDEGLGFPSNYFKIFGFERVKELQEEG